MKQKIYDLTYTIHENMAVYPGTEKPIIYEAYNIEKWGFEEKKLTMYSHTGTHMDAPAHMVQGGKHLEDFDSSKFVGKAVLITIKKESGKITEEEVIKYFNEYKIINDYTEIEFVILYTGWGKHWGSETYFGEYSSLSLEAVKWIKNKFKNLKGIGVDTISVDPMGSHNFENHHELLKDDIVIIENIANLNKIDERIFEFMCLPVKFENSDGAPVRAIGIV
ncbi:cyclase family protein [Oceanirhabdus sp. W0125-5]|uniref:cyclase family protein n=1 Tax=Oceanirhabdus sp. W0125-5 TaxID=2999116 RepID=UPI0022F33FD4|nr:cyclase family protein [Oceanirhabdus sp. W0125-5]WBW96907.1 cyclase family protein [Oceanirhabdus sp. W0125-5]